MAQFLTGHDQYWSVAQELGTPALNDFFNLAKGAQRGDGEHPGSSDGKESACNAGDWGSIPGLARSPGEGNHNPLQYSCLENPMDRGAWQAIVHGVAKNRTQLSD